MDVKALVFAKVEGKIWVRFLFHFKPDSSLSRYIQQVIHHRLDQRNTFFGPNRLGFSFWIAGYEWAIRARGRFGVSEDMNPLVDLFLELVLVDKTIDLHGAEEVADTFAHAAVRNLLP